MKHEDIQKIVDVRSFLIEKYNKLDGTQQPAAMIKQSDVAETLQYAIQTIDGLLSGKVTFK
jgi:hypothetical protein